MELSGRPRDPSGALEEPILEHVGPFLEVILEYKCRVLWAPEWSSISFSCQHVFPNCSDFDKMADIVPDS